MELSGFRIIDVEPPSPDAVEKVVRAFGERPLALGGSTTHVYGKQECEDFLQSGLSTSIRDIARKELRIPSDEMIVNQKAIVGHNHGPQEGPKTAHPSKNAVSFIRVVTGSMDHGTLKLYRSSHHQTMEEFRADQVTPDRPILAPDKLLIMHGPIKCEINPPQGCLLVWMGVSEQPMLDDSESPHALYFMKDIPRTS